MTAGSARVDAERARGTLVTSIMRARPSVGLHDGRGAAASTPKKRSNTFKAAGAAAAAMASVLDQGADHDLRRIGRAPSAPPRLILEVVARYPGSGTTFSAVPVLPEIGTE